MHGLLSDPHRRHFLLTLLVGLGLAAYLAGSLRAVYGFDLAMLLALGGGFPIYLEALLALGRRKISADLAVSLAAAAALLVGWRSAPDARSDWYLVAAEVIFIMLVGEAVEHFAVGRTRAGIAALLKLRPHLARVRRGDHELEIHADQIRAEDVVLLRPGDRIPVDGRVESGHSSVDQSPITGESLPADKGPGDEVFAGTINLYGAMELSVERLGHDTTLERIIHLVEHAEAAKAPAERLADRYAGYFVPIVLVAAGLVYMVTRDVSRSVAVLVVACPCALVLATPTAIAAGIGRLVRRGVLVKGGAVLEGLGRLRTVVFDKTGTLTLARLQVHEVVASAGHTADEVLRLAAAVERRSEHPLARVVVARAAECNIDPPVAEHFRAHPGLGAEAELAGATVRVGSPRYLETAAVGVADALAAEVARLGQEGSTVVLVAHGAEAIGAIAVRDTVRPEAREAIEELRGLGVLRVVMLTGDHEAAARAVAAQLGIDDIRAGLLPADKVEAIRVLRGGAGPVAMVGDGINDAPSLVAADVGVAMADIGSDVAIASADLVLVGGDLRKLADAMDCGRRVLRTIRQNTLAFAVVLNLAAVAAASLGWLSPVAAAVLHQVSSLTVVLNSLRLLADGQRWRRRMESWGKTWIARWRSVAATGAAILAAAYLAGGLHVVRIGELGVVQRFGRLVEPIETPGLHYRLPWPAGRHVVVRPDEVRRVEIGFRTSRQQQSEPPAYEWNVQHRGGRYERQDDEAVVWAGDENLVDVNFVVHYRVGKPTAALFTVGQTLPDGTSKWDTLLRAVGEAAFRAEMSCRPIDALLGPAREEIAEAVRGRVGRMLEGWQCGLAVESVCLGDIHPPADVVPAFREVSSAMEQKEAQINEAGAYEYQTKALARGERDAQIARAEGFLHDRTQRAGGAAERFLKVAAAYAEAPEVTRLRLYLQTIDETLAGKRKVILDHVSGAARRSIYLGRKGLWSAAPAAAEAPPATVEPKGTQP